MSVLEYALCAYLLALPFLAVGIGTCLRRADGDFDPGLDVDAEFDRLTASLR